MHGRSTAVNHHLERAIRFHRAGNVKGAEAEYRRILRRDPGNAEALHLLGLIAAQAGELPTAAALIAKAIEIHGPAPAFCENLAAVFEGMGQPDSAAICYQQAVSAGAARPELFYRLGANLLQAGQPGPAAGAFERALRLDPEFPEALFQLGNAFHQMGRPGEAAEAYRQSLALDPRHPEAHYNLGVALMMTQRLEEARASFEQAVRLKPDYAEAHNNLGILRHSLGAPEDAVHHYREALRAAPEYLDARYNLGRALQDSGDLEEAARAFHAVIERQPGHAEAHHDLGNVLLALGSVDRAAAAFRHALKHDPGHRESRFGRGLVELTRGHFRAGWEGYESRALPPALACPRWDGLPLKGRSIVLQTEQGFGDAIQFIRYAARFKELGGVVVAACRQPLHRLMLTARGVDAVTLETGTPAGADCYFPLLSSPAVFGADLDTIPHDVPYFEIAAAPKREWEARLRAPAGHLRVGLAWAGNPKHKNDRNRSIPPERLAALRGIPNTTFYSLQKELGPGGEPALGLAPLGGELTDFAETAALITRLDLVITVDTAVAHLAGALCRPVWTLLPYAPDWRWMLDREDSPWYPTMRLFRQPSRGEWTPVVERLREALANEQTRAGLVRRRE
jgi:tetratricopeptide (TPR) repeat protein